MAETSTHTKPPLYLVDLVTTQHSAHSAARDKKATATAAGLKWMEGHFATICTDRPLTLRPCPSYIYPNPPLYLPHHSPIYPDFRQEPNPACTVSYQLDSGCQGQPQQILLTYLKSGRK